MLFSLTYILSSNDWPKPVVVKLECQKADSRTETGNIKDDPGASCSVIK